MPFVARCPHTACQKYSIVEDELRGQRIRCLACKREMPAEPLATITRNCPNPDCRAKIAVPGDSLGRRIQCPNPKCKQVFQ